MIKDRKTGYLFTSTDYSVKEVLNGKDILTLYVKEGSEDAKRVVNEMTLVEEAYSKAEFVVKKVSTSTGGLLEVEADLNTDYFRQSIFVGFSKAGSPFNILNSVVPDGWTVEDHTGISESKTVELDGPTALGVADSVYSIFNVGIRYDFERKQQHLYNLDAFKADGQYMTKELNLVSIDRYSDSKDLINRLYARGKDGLTFADINNGKDYVEDTSYLSGKIVSDFIKDDRFENKESLLAYAQETLKSRLKPKSSYECKPIDIGAENTKYAFLKLALMNVVTLLDVDNNTRADHQVVEKIVHPYDTTQNELTLSTKIPTLTDDTSYVSDQISNPNSDFNQKLQSDMDRIANAVLQASGGYIIINFGGDGKMAEILVMDTNDKKTAKNVMRINMGGIAFSTSGYNGPFNGAWALNGEFFTQFIATWKLSAALLVAGKLQDKTGRSYWDLDTGKMVLNGDFQNTNGDYMMKFWAAIFTMFHGEYDRAQIYASAGDKSTTSGVLTLSQGKYKGDSGGHQDENSRQTYIDATNLSVGNNRDGVADGNIYTGTLNAEKGISAKGNVQSNGRVKGATMECTRFAPTGKSELRLDWVRVNKADGSGATWALCGE